MFYIIVNIIILLFLLIKIYSFIFGNNSQKLPPIPKISLPLIGHFHYLFAYEQEGIYNLFSKWSKELNSSIIRVNLGTFRSIVINDTKSIKEALNMMEFSGRPISEAKFLRFGTDGKERGILLSSGPRWQEQRRFTLRHLRDFGFSKSSYEMECKILAEIKHVIDTIDSSNMSPISTKVFFNMAILNLIWTIFTGKRFDHDDARLVSVVKSTKAAAEDSRMNGIVFFMPSLCYLAPEWSGFNFYKKSLSEVNELLAEVIDSHFDQFNPEEDEPTNFIDRYILEIHKTNNDPSSSFYKSDGRENLICSFRDIFEAGHDTTSVTLEWMFLYLALHENYQSLVHEEIDRVIGHDREPSLSDKNEMIFTEACILETLRNSSILPLSIFHCALQDVKFNNYEIPKDSVIFTNLYAANHEHKIWGNDAHCFNPHRFISSNGLTNTDLLLSFSYGKRVCIGESLAKMELFLFTTSILQKFSVKLDHSEKKPSMKPQGSSIILSPQPHKLIFTKRF